MLIISYILKTVITIYRKYEFAVPHYRSAVKFTLVDAISEKKVISVLKIITIISQI